MASPSRNTARGTASPSMLPRPAARVCRVAGLGLLVIALQGLAIGNDSHYNAPRGSAASHTNAAVNAQGSPGESTDPSNLSISAAYLLGRGLKSGGHAAHGGPVRARGKIRGVALSAALKAANSLAPNVLLMVADDLQSSDLGGDFTPNINSLGTSGVTFADAHTPSPLCTPSRYSILSGRYASCYFCGFPSSQALLPMHLFLLTIA